MAINLFGGEARLRIGDETIDDDAEQLDIPIHAFDLIIADECHRGYTAAGAVRLAQHARPLRRDQDRPDRHAGRPHQGVLQRRRLPLRVRAGRPRGLPRRLRRRDDQVRRPDERRLPQGRRAGRAWSTPRPAREQLDQLEDERHVRHHRGRAQGHRARLEPQDPRGAEEATPTSTSSEYGRFPKTLIFAANDLPHTSHADQLVDTGPRRVRPRRVVRRRRSPARVDRPLQRIREFRNRPKPGIVVRSTCCPPAWTSRTWSSSSSCGR